MTGISNKFPLVLLLLSVVNLGFCQETPKDDYELSFKTIEAMLSGKTSISFKRAVLSTERAYFEIDTTVFNKAISDLVYQCRAFSRENKLLYDKKDKETVATWASIFKVMTDTTYSYLTRQYGVMYKPFQYDFDDFFGEKDWSKMFVSKLLETGSGNCHSMPYLYKIIAEELGTTAHLALAPNHVYIKHWSIKDGWYNTELTSAAFPIDAWIMVSGYVHLDAIENQVYMKALEAKESVALCMIDLAEGYKRKVKDAEPEFILKCCETALLYFPNFINALILKAETNKALYEVQVRNNPTPDRETKDQLSKQFNDLQNQYAHIHELGYRQMPKDMYLKWLAELRTEKEKYQNKSISTFPKN